MKTLTAPLITQKDADQSGWAELYDFYLKAAISTPWGTISTIRLTTLPGDLAFFTPQHAPEPVGTQGDAATYHHWPIKREIVRAASQTANDKLMIAASNVTTEWAQMLAAVDWYDTPVVIRKVSTTIAVPTADDCVTIFSGLIDSAKITLEQLQFACSNDLGNLSSIAPRENMHQNCRFGWADDQCTAIRYLEENYKAGTVGSGSSMTLVKSADFNEDTAHNRYTGQAVTVDATTDKITLAAHFLSLNDTVRFSAAVMPTGLTAGTTYYVVNKATNDFKVAATLGGSAIDITTNGTSVLMDSDPIYGTDIMDQIPDGSITASSTKVTLVNVPVTFQLGAFGTVSFSIAQAGLITGDPVVFAGSVAPSGITFGVTYYLYVYGGNWFSVTTIPDDPDGTTRPTFGSAGSGVDISTVGNYAASNVKASNANGWRFQQASDWGTNVQGYWQIPDAQAGLKNALLEPFIHFDFGGAVTPKVWRVASGANARSEDLVRLIEIFAFIHNSAAVTVDNTTDKVTLAAHGLKNWDTIEFAGSPLPGGLAFETGYFARDVTTNDFKVAATIDGAAIDITTNGTSVIISAFRLMTYFEMRPVGGRLFDVLMPKSISKRFWRICVRSRWGEAVSFGMFDEIRAFELSRNWWAYGRIVFDSNTATVALRNISRPVLESYSGEIIVPPLPAAPANGDTFVIERGCPRTFNGCTERQNWENFGGFLDLPNQAIIR
jgi:hypothetical protein